MSILATSRFFLLAWAVALPAQDDGAWNQWLGPRRDGRATDKGLLKEWPDGGPTLAWRVDGLGAGFSSVSFAGRRIFTMGDVDDAAELFALDVSNGEVRWSARVGAAGGKRNPGPRSTPSTDGERVYGLGQDSALVCADAATGKVRWRRNLREDFGGRMMSGWGYSESPLLDGDLLVCMPGGRKGTVLALHKKTGKVAWRSGDFTDRAPYTSLVPAEIGGVRQYLAFTGRSVAGVAAKDGALLWRGERPGRTAICSTPVYAEGRLFVSSAYNVGCNGFEITAKRGKFAVREVYGGKQLQSHHGGIVLVDAHVYGTGRRKLKCLDLATGDVVWEQRGVGKGSITYADGLLIVRGERGGDVALVEATPDGYHEKGRFAQPDPSGEPAWAYPVVHGGRLYIRDQGLLLCYDLRDQ